MALVLLLEHYRQEDPDAVYDSPEVDPEHPLPVGKCAFPDGPARTPDARVVADDVHRAEGLERLLRELLHLLRLRDVGADREHRRAPLAHLGVGLIEGALFHIREHDLHTFGRKALGEAAADPARCARHDCHSVSKLSHVAPC